MFKRYEKVKNYDPLMYAMHICMYAHTLYLYQVCHGKPIEIHEIQVKNNDFISFCPYEGVWFSLIPSRHGLRYHGHIQQDQRDWLRYHDQIR